MSGFGMRKPAYERQSPVQTIYRTFIDRRKQAAYQEFKLMLAQAKCWKAVTGFCNDL